VSPNGTRLAFVGPAPGDSTQLYLRDLDAPEARPVAGTEGAWHPFFSPDGRWLGWGPVHHWTDTKIRVHAFYCMLGISLLKTLQHEAQRAWPDLSVEQLLEELREIQQVVLLYPPQGEKGPCRTATVLAKQSLTQQLLVTTLGLDQLGTTPRRSHNRVATKGAEAKG